MNRLCLTTVAAAVLAAAPTFALVPQTRPAVPAPPGSEEWLRLRGEAYSRAPDSKQIPAEVAATARLNAEVAARNDAAARAEAQGQADFAAQNARWREENARVQADQADWQAATAAVAQARAQWERDHAAWEAEMAACRSSGRVCVTPPPPPPPEPPTAPPTELEPD